MLYVASSENTSVFFYLICVSDFRLGFLICVPIKVCKLVKE